MHGTRVARWEKALEWPLMIAAGVFLIAYALQILSPPDGRTEALAEVALWATWAVFAVDYLVRLMLAEQRWHWFSRHLVDLAIVVLPMLRPLRLMRFLTILTIIQRNAGSMLRGRVVIYTVGTTVLAILLAGLAVFDAERDSGSGIDSIGDAIWWAFVTITTVGYGDLAPVTVTGRAVAVALMVGGIALIGVVTATLASWIVERVADDTDRAQGASAEQVAQLQQEIAEIRALLVDLRGTGSST